MLPMSRGKQPSSTLQRRFVRSSRPSPYPTVLPKAPPPPPTPLPSELRVSHVLAPSIQGVLLVPLTSFQLNQHGQWTLGQGVVQFFQTPTVLVPTPNPPRLVVPDVKPAGPPPIQKKTINMSEPVPVPGPSSTVVQPLPEPSLAEVIAPPIAQALPSAPLGPWPSLKKHQQAALERRRRYAGNRPGAAGRSTDAGDGEDDEIDDGKLLASTRFGRNHRLMGTVLDATVVRPSKDRSQQLSSTIDLLEKRLKDAQDETEMMQVRFDQKLEGIRSAANLFQYKLDRFQQLGALIKCPEFQQAVLETEVQNLQGSSGVEGHGSGFQ